MSLCIGRFIRFPDDIVWGDTEPSEPLGLAFFPVDACISFSISFNNSNNWHFFLQIHWHLHVLVCFEPASWFGRYIPNALATKSILARNSANESTWSFTRSLIDPCWQSAMNTVLSSTQRPMSWWRDERRADPLELSNRPELAMTQRLLPNRPTHFTWWLFGQQDLTFPNKMIHFLWALDFSR